MERRRCGKQGPPNGPGRRVHALIDRHRADIALLWRHDGIRRLEVFGSAARGFDFGPATSDADFLIEFDPESNLPPPQHFFGLAEALETLLQRPVDLVERGAIDYPFLVADIARAHEVVYAG